MQNCGNCTHYLQRYILSRGKLRYVYCGHCTYAKPKTKKPDVPACQHYAPKPSDTGEYATKEYLTKKSLNYVLGLELLPEIPDAPVEANMDG